MGYIKHHAIVVTSWNDKFIEAAHAKAVEFCRSVTDLTEPAVNGQRSFLVAPDGSKEGWTESDHGDATRALFMRWLDEQRYDDGSTSLAWAEVVIGADDNEAHVERHAWSSAETPARG